MPENIDRLVGQAWDFAQRIDDLLNRTVTNGIRVMAVLNSRDGDCAIGYGIKSDDFSLRGIPLSIGGKAPTAYLGVQHWLCMDDSGEYLADVRSRFQVALDEEMKNLILRYEYKRDNEPHPEAHFHFYGSLAGEPIQNVKPLKSLHWPVGGRRFRPTLEDVIRFLILEGFVEGRDGWGAALAEHWDDYFENQLKAAVRRNPAAAIAQLKADGHL